MQYSLSDVASYISVKINTDDISLDEYISTENMLPDKGGITRATSLPSTAKTNSFQEGDVLFSNIRTYFRKIWFATFKGGVSNDVLVIRSLNEDILFNKYLYYLLSDKAFIQHTITTAKGTKMPRGDKSAIMNYQFELPPLPTQKKIAYILSTLDDKIELNRKMNETLEAMAQALFKSWFVDFDPVIAKAKAKSEQELEVAASRLGISKEILDLFPSEFEESEMGMIPFGWEVKPISEVSFVAIGKTPPRKEPKWFTLSDSDVKWISIKDMGNSGTYIVDTNEYLTKEAIEKFNVKIIPANTVLLSFKLTLGRVSITTEKMTSNEAIAHFVLKENSLLSSEYIYCYLKNFDYSMLGSTSSIATAINSKIVKTIPTIVANEITIQMFNSMVQPIFKQILTLTKEMHALQKTRDTLLPKLLSGELDVSNIHIGLDNEA